MSNVLNPRAEAPVNLLQKLMPNMGNYKKVWRSLPKKISSTWEGPILEWVTPALRPGSATDQRIQNDTKWSFYASCEFMWTLQIYSNILIQISATICYGTTSQEFGDIIWVWHDLKMWQKNLLQKVCSTWGGPSNWSYHPLNLPSTKRRWNLIPTSTRAPTATNRWVQHNFSLSKSM